MDENILSLYSELTKSVYDAMADDTSKQMFILRLNYFLTNDIGYLKEMASVSHRADKDGRKTIQNLLDNHSLCDNGVILYGAGIYAEQLVQTFHDNGIGVICFCDSSPEKHGSTHCGLPIIAPSELSQKVYGANPVVISSELYPAEIYQKLLNLGVSEHRIYWPVRSEQYFGEHFLRPVDNEIYIDAGTFDGYTINRFILFCGGKFKKVFGFEPARKNLNLINEMMKPDERIEIIPKGVYSDKTVQKFVVDAPGYGSHIGADGDETIGTITIDEVVGDEAVTFIKMDVEGAELQALIGAKNTIRKNSPRLAISIYHKPEDILTIPLYVKQLVPEYRLYIRHYRYFPDTCETILYAIL